jgi:hypothetical protein
MPERTGIADERDRHPRTAGRRSRGPGNGGELTVHDRLRLPDSETEIVLATAQEYAPNWLVTSADEAARVVVSAGGRLLNGPFDIPVGRAAVVADPFGNALVMLDLSRGTYVTDGTKRVTGLASDPAAGTQ